MLEAGGAPPAHSHPCLTCLFSRLQAAFSYSNSALSPLWHCCRDIFHLWTVDCFFAFGLTDLHTLGHSGSRLLLWLLLTTITQAGNTVLQGQKILSRCIERAAWLWKLDSAFKQCRIFGDGGAFSHHRPKNPPDQLYSLGYFNSCPQQTLSEVAWSLKKDVKYL